MVNALEVKWQEEENAHMARGRGMSLRRVDHVASPQTAAAWTTAAHLAGCFVQKLSSATAECERDEKCMREKVRDRTTREARVQDGRRNLGAQLYYYGVWAFCDVNFIMAQV